MTGTKSTILIIAIISSFTLNGCGINPFDLSLLTNNAFANAMVSFLKNLGAPIGMEERPEGDDPANRLAKISARTLGKIAAGEVFETLSGQDTEDSLKAWFGNAFVITNKNNLIQSGDSILFATLVNDTDNFEVKNGSMIINIGNRGLLNQENFRFWAFKGHNKKIRIVGKGDKAGEEGNVTGLVFIPSRDRRIIWKGVVTRQMDGVEPGDQGYNVGDSAHAELDSIIKEGDEWIQYGTAVYWDSSARESVWDINMKIYHNKTIGLDKDFWDDNRAETHFILENKDPKPGEGRADYYIAATHFGEYYPSKNSPYGAREEGIVYRERSCADPDIPEDECTLKNGFNYSGKYIVYEKPRGNAPGDIYFYDEDGKEIDHVVEGDADTGM